MKVGDAAPIAIRARRSCTRFGLLKGEHLLRPRSLRGSAASARCGRPERCGATSPHRACAALRSPDSAVAAQVSPFDMLRRAARSGGPAPMRVQGPTYRAGCARTAGRGATATAGHRGQRRRRRRIPSLSWMMDGFFWTFPKRIGPELFESGAGPLSWWRASPRRQIDSRTHLLLRTDYCSPLKSGLIGALPVPAPLLSKRTNGTRRLSQARPNCWRFHHDLARRPSDRPIVRGRAILWWLGGRSYPFKVAASSPSPRRVPRRHCPCRDSAGLPDVVACRRLPRSARGQSSPVVADTPRKPHAGCSRFPGIARPRVYPSYQPPRRG
jgi:hypothetical protein